MGQQGSPLSQEAKRTVVDLKHYFDRTRNDLAEESLLSVNKVSHALNIGIATIRRIMADYNRDPNSLQNGFSLRGRPQRAICDASQTISRDYVRKANAEGRHITLEMLHDHLNETWVDEQK